MTNETEYTNRPRSKELEVAHAIINACADKPIRRVTTEFLGHSTKLKCKPLEEPTPTKLELSRSESRKLQTRIVTYLLNNGPSTGKMLAKALGSNVGKIGNAVTHQMIGRKQIIDPVSKSYSTLFYIIRD